MSKTGQPNLPELRIYYVSSTRLDVHLVSSKNPSKTMMDKSLKHYFAILQNSLNSLENKKTGQFAQHSIRNITSRVWIWLKGFSKFLRSLSLSAFKQTALKQETIPHRPYLVYVIDPFTHLIVDVYVATDQKEVQ